MSMDDIIWDKELITLAYWELGLALRPPDTECEFNIGDAFELLTLRWEPKARGRLEALMETLADELVSGETQWNEEDLQGTHSALIVHMTDWMCTRTQESQVAMQSL